ncbi:exported hypothetical protein [Candidatus Sulfopaludibacter sp. SbA3]|nr:exported hypothetical protein [Candidatus Sulfopaludibacter sp. SbA3]
MVKSFALLAVFTSVVAAANAPIREVTSDAAVVSGMPVPAFSKGYIYWAGLEPLRIYTADGHPQPHISTPNGRVEAIAADTDGTLALAWTSETTGGIDLHDPSGALVKTVQTGRYRPTHLSFAEDHSLWCLGWQVDASNAHMPDKADYMIIRRILADGQLAGAYLARSLFPRGLEPGAESWQQSNRITVSHNGVGLWVYSGMYGAKTEWVELDLNGNLTGRWRLDQFVNDLRVAFTSDGHVFVYHRDLDGRNPGVHTLDRASSTWQMVQSAPTGYLVSADGEALIFADFGLGPIHLRWYQHP